MNRQSLPLGKILGVPFGIDYSWFLIFALLTWTLAHGYFPNEFKNWPAIEYWVIGALTALCFFGSVLLHELAHSLVAIRFRIPVRKITLFIFGGISELAEEPATPAAQFWISIAGPLTNLALAGVFALITLLVRGFAPLLAVFKYLQFINLFLGLFNLVPGFPLDGGNALMALVWGGSGRKRWGILAAAWIGNFLAYLLIIVGVIQMFSGDTMNGLWTAFIGWFVMNASTTAVRKERLQELLAGHKVGEVMGHFYTIIYANTTLQELVDEHILGGSRRIFLVEDQGQMAGLLTLPDLQKVSKQDYPVTKVDQVMVPIARVKQIGPNTELWQAIAEMDSDGVNQLPVMEDGKVLGMLTREDVISYLSRLQVK
jgi:Zn-dependent protease